MIALDVVAKRSLLAALAAAIGGVGLTAAGLAAALGDEAGRGLAIWLVVVGGAIAALLMALRGRTRAHFYDPERRVIEVRGGSAAAETIPLDAVERVRIAHRRIHTGDGAESVFPVTIQTRLRPLDLGAPGRYKAALAGAERVARTLAVPLEDAAAQGAAEPAF